MAPSPKVVEPPTSGLWRVGRSPDPLRFSDPLDPGLLESRATGNRFDSPTGDYRVCYFATTLDGCFGETLSRFRPDPGLSSIADEEEFMALGEVPAGRPSIVVVLVGAVALMLIAVYPVRNLVKDPVRRLGALGRDAPGGS